MARMREGAEGEREVMGIEGDAYRLGRDFCAWGMKVSKGVIEEVERRT